MNASWAASLPDQISGLGDSAVLIPTFAVDVGNFLLKRYGLFQLNVAVACFGTRPV